MYIQTSKLKDTTLDIDKVFFENFVLHPLAFEAVIWCLRNIVCYGTINPHWYACMLIWLTQYPHGIEDMDYDPDFAIRGLHCDISRGLLMKIDAYNHIHLSSVHRQDSTHVCLKCVHVCPSAVIALMRPLNDTHTHAFNGRLCALHVT